MTPLPKPSDVSMVTIDGATRWVIAGICDQLFAAALARLRDAPPGALCVVDVVAELATDVVDLVEAADADDESSPLEQPGSNTTTAPVLTAPTRCRFTTTPTSGTTSRPRLRRRSACTHPGSTDPHRSSAPRPFPVRRRPPRTGTRRRRTPAT